jgi:hypothetical protein
MDKVMPRIEFWPDFGPMAESLLHDRCATAAHIGSRWQQYKRATLARLHDDVEDLVGLRHFDGPWDHVTVVVFTSPVKSNPDLSMIKATIESLRIDLPGAEVLIAADGVRDEQAHLADNYAWFLHELAQWANRTHNVWLITHHEHLHQSGLLRSVLPQVKTEYLLFMEHDCPVEGVIPFSECLETMSKHDLNVMRFSHEAHVLAEHDHLFLDLHPDDPAPWRETLQYSARPHLARTDWYRSMVETYMGSKSRTFTEDLLYGIIQAGPVGDGMGEDGENRRTLWEWSRMALYHPPGGIRRSTHLDGRQGEPKGTIVWHYDGERPLGAPAPGVFDA